MWGLGCVKNGHRGAFLQAEGLAKGVPKKKKFELLALEF
jgi:hypothetical protein